MKNPCYGYLLLRSCRSSARALRKVLTLAGTSAAAFALVLDAALLELLDIRADFLGSISTDFCFRVRFLRVVLVVSSDVSSNNSMCPFETVLTSSS